MRYVAALCLLIVSAVVGCGPTLHSGKVVAFGHKPESFWMMPIYTGDTTFFIPQTDPEQHWVVVRGEVDGKTVDRRVYTDVTHSGLAIGDSWTDRK